MAPRVAATNTDAVASDGTTASNAESGGAGPTTTQTESGRDEAQQTDSGRSDGDRRHASAAIVELSDEHHVLLAAEYVGEVVAGIAKTRTRQTAPGAI